MRHVVSCHSVAYAAPALVDLLAELHKVVELAEKGRLVPAMDQVFPLREAAEAHRRMESRKNFGKIVLRI